MIVNVIARIIVQRGRLKDVDLDVDIEPDIGPPRPRRSRLMSADPHALLLDRGNLRRRNRLNRMVEALATIAAVLAVAVLVIVVGSVLLKGVGALSWHFLTTPTALFGESGGGIANAIVGSAIIVGARRR